MRSGPKLLILMAFLLASSEVLAQQGASELRGRVMDNTGGALPGVTVTIRNQASGIYRQAASTTDGAYFMTGVIPGTYELTAEISGFRKYSRKDLRLEVGKTATVDVHLEIGGVQEELVVTAEAPIVDVTSKEVGGNITSQDLISLPSVNRNFIGFIGLLPGIVPSISTESFGSDSVNVNGQDARNNNYLVDGANNNDDVIGQRAGTQARPSLESIQEFQVLTSQYDAEFGRTTGAIINAVVKQGANAFHGSAFYFLQDASLTAKDFFVKQNNLKKPDTRYQQYGFTVGGPIVKNKAHFFLALERPANDRATTITIPARPEFNASPTTKDRVWNSLIRLDYQMSQNHSWSVRWLRESSPQLNQIIPVGTRQVTEAASRQETDIDQTVVGSLTSVLGNTKTNVVRVAFTREDVAFANPAFSANGGHQDQLPPTLQFLTFVDQQSAVAQARVNNAYAFDDTFNWFIPGSKGDHNIRAGVQYEYVDVFSTAQDNWNGTFMFRTNAFNANDPSTYPERLQIRVPGPSEYTQKEEFFSAFAQDKWRMGKHLTLSLGLRYDVEKIPLPEVDNPRFASAGDYPVDKNNVSPRVGFAYDVKGDGRMVVRGGYGRFYDKTHLELVSAVITGGVFSNSFTVNFPANNADPGPSQGRLPTDPFLANGPTVNRGLLAQRFPAGSRLKNSGTVTLDNPDRVIPYTDQLSAGLERQLTNDMSVSLDYVHAFGRDQFQRLNLNPGLRASTTRTATVTRVDPDFVGSVETYVNTGRTQYDAVQVGIEKRASRNYQFRASYTYSKGRGNTSGNGAPLSNFQLLNDMHLELNEGPTDFDRPHNFVASGAVVVPRTGGLTLSTVVRYLSGLAFTVEDTTLDNDRNGILFEPLPAGTYSGNGTNAITVESDGGRNGARGPSFFQADMRLGYRFKLGGHRRLEAFGEVYNLTDRANFANPTGDRFSTNFLRVTALRAGAIPRTVQLGARVEF
jgi:TonB dependent receptor/Carboxypeptidase regulatory-like domain/TonB-dependent Receptor Plug Domain